MRIIITTEWPSWPQKKVQLYNINIHVFNQLNTPLPDGPAENLMLMIPKGPKELNRLKVVLLIFSPHPDDDVISMGGTFLRLVDQGHDVHVAYQTSGNTAVWDTDVLRYVEFAIDFNKSIGE